MENTMFQQCDEFMRKLKENYTALFKALSDILGQEYGIRMPDGFDFFSETDAVYQRLIEERYEDGYEAVPAWARDCTIGKMLLDAQACAIHSITEPMRRMPVFKQAFSSLCVEFPHGDGYSTYPEGTSEIFRTLSREDVDNIDIELYLKGTGKLDVTCLVYSVTDMSSDDIKCSTEARKEVILQAVRYGAALEAANRCFPDSIEQRNRFRDKLLKKINSGKQNMQELLLLLETDVKTGKADNELRDYFELNPKKPKETEAER